MWPGSSCAWRPWHFSQEGKLEQIQGIILAVNAIIKVIGKKGQGYAYNKCNQQQ